MSSLIRIAAVTAALLVLPLTLRSAELDRGPPPRFLTANQLGADADELGDAFKTLHPGIYRYLSEDDFDQQFALFKASMEHSQTDGDAFLAIARFSSAIKCGHTWTNPLNQSEPVARDILDKEDRLPLHFRVIGRRFLVTQVAGTSLVQVNDEITAIDGVPVSSVIARLWPFLRADGASDGKRLAQIGHEAGQSAFDLYYALLAPPVANTRTLTLRYLGSGRSRQVRVQLASEEVRERALGGVNMGSKQWTYAVHGSSAIISMPTWAFWNKPFDWHGWMKSVFAELKAKRVQSLIIDLRSNEGGDGAIGDALATYLATSQHRYRSHMPIVSFDVIPDRLRPDISTWDQGFLDLRSLEQPLGAGKFTLTDADPEWVTIAPAENAFGGTVFVLIGPNDSSATYEFARVVKDTHIATLVGQPSGGNLRGINGGKMVFFRLHNSGITVDVPLVAWTSRDAAPDSPVMPDLTVPPDLEAIAAGRDPDLERVHELMATTNQ